MRFLNMKSLLLFACAHIALVGCRPDQTERVDPDSSVPVVTQEEDRATQNTPPPADLGSEMLTGVEPESVEEGSIEPGSVEPEVKHMLTNPAQHWVATDALGRTLPAHEAVGAPRHDKWVGVFYYIWVGNHSRKVWDITEILKQPKAERQWGPQNSFHFWGEPEYGYYHASDPFVIRHDMQMLANAGVDFIFFDVTNARTYPETVLSVCEVISQMRAQGIAAPSLCYLTNTQSGETMNKIYDELYAKGLYEDLWFHWQGKPLILGDPNDPVLRPEVKEFFTLKRSWAWSSNKWFGDGQDKWPWLERYPQQYGWSESPEIPEQITVSVANHPGRSGGPPIGKSFKGGQLPPVHENYLTDYTDQGLQFEEQWSQAHEVDPQMVMITQWNEWLAQRSVMGGDRRQGLLKSWAGSYAGRPIDNGDSYFIDVFSREFNRDIAPMKGGYTDNYYYQLVSNVRKFKGMKKPQPRPLPTRITIDGQFSDWDAVKTVHRDPVGDTVQRHFEGTDKKTVYTNDSGRNDIVESKVVSFEKHLFFHVKTERPLTPHTDPKWMLLLIDSDQNSETGWEGYDHLINRSPESATKTSLEKWTYNGWKRVGTLQYAYGGNQLELSIPLGFEPEERPGVGIDFKWADNPGESNDMSGFFLNGDAAPDRRFNYRY
jgi:hypothetical protein